MNYMLRILGPLAAFAVIFGLAYCTQSAEEIYNRTDNFFVDTETERSFAFHLNNYTDKPLMLVYQKSEGEWNLGGIVPYAEWGGNVVFPFRVGMRA